MSGPTRSGQNPAPDASSWELFFEIIRFGIAGGAATLLYGLLSLLLTWSTGRPAITVHVLAYFLALPVSFLAQGLFTFRYRGKKAHAFTRFLVVAVVAFGLSTVSVYFLRDIPVYGRYLGIVATMLLVPLISFVTMKLWVFHDRLQ